jgi:hypothetical protein
MSFSRPIQLYPSHADPFKTHGFRNFFFNIIKLIFFPRHVRLKDASKLSVKGLRTLKGHKIIELEALGLTRATVTDLLGCLGEWSLHNLRLLNVTNSTFMGSNKHCVVVALSKLKNLQVLNVANTEFNKTSLVRKWIFISIYSLKFSY